MHITREVLGTNKEHAVAAAWCSAEPANTYSAARQTCDSAVENSFESFVVNARPWLLSENVVWSGYCINEPISVLATVRVQTHVTTSE
eukprot:1688456-Amphidinium_carterae.1